MRDGCSNVWCCHTELVHVPLSVARRPQRGRGTSGALVSRDVSTNKRFALGACRSAVSDTHAGWHDTLAPYLPHTTDAYSTRAAADMSDGCARREAQAEEQAMASLGRWGDEADMMDDDDGDYDFQPDKQVRRSPRRVAPPLAKAIRAAGTQRQAGRRACRCPGYRWLPHGAARCAEAVAAAEGGRATDRGRAVLGQRVEIVGGAVGVHSRVAADGIAARARWPRRPPGRQTNTLPAGDRRQPRVAGPCVRSQRLRRCRCMPLRPPLSGGHTFASRGGGRRGGAG